MLSPPNRAWRAICGRLRRLSHGASFGRSVCTVARAAFDASGKRLGTQVGTYRRGAPNGMVVEMTYLEPDADHPVGQAFDGAGNPMPMHTGPDMPIDRGMAGRVPILPVPYRDFRRVLEVRQIFFDLRVGRSVFTSPVGVGR